MDAFLRLLGGDAIRDLFENPREDSAPLMGTSPGTLYTSMDSDNDHTDVPEARGNIDLQRSSVISSAEQPPASHHDETLNRQTSVSDVGVASQTEEHAEEYMDEMPVPQLSARDLEMIPYGEDGNGTAMTVTREFVWEVNTVLRCDNKIARYTKELDQLEKQIEKVAEGKHKIERQLAELSEDEHEERSKKEDLLEYGKNLTRELADDKEKLLIKLEKVRKERKAPKEDISQSLKRVFRMYNLLEDISGTSDSGHVSEEPSHKKPATPEPPKSPTESEVQRAAEGEARYAAYDRKEELKARVYNARERLDNWYLEYAEDYQSYKELLARGDTDDTKTIFDNHMFCVQQDIVQDLILSERELQEAIDDARALCIVFGGPDQESNFQDYADDGYRISHEQEWIQDLDRSKIEKWVNGLPNDEPPSPLEALEGDADEWDVRSVGFGESISVIAEGKPRVRIDRWRSTLKQEHFTRFDEDVDTGVEHQHSHQKRRCRRTNTL